MLEFGIFYRIKIWGLLIFVPEVNIKEKKFYFLPKKNMIIKLFYLR
jgi:hypothetical protein